MEKLTSKEEEVMELIWQLGQCAPKDVATLYPEPRPSANAIAQIFQALEKKEYLAHERMNRKDAASSIGLLWTSKHTEEDGCRVLSIASSATRI